MKTLLIVKILPFLPGRFCIKNTFPLFTINNAKNTVKKTGLRIIIPTNEIRQSNNDLK